MQFRTNPVVRRKTAFLLVLCLCAITVTVGHVVALDITNVETHDHLFGKIWVSILLSWWILPAGFLHATLGYSEATLPYWASLFAWGYCATVLLLFGRFIWMPRWWLWAGAAALLLGGAAGCSGYVATIHFVR
jgi:hypothetical protein